MITPTRCNAQLHGHYQASSFITSSEVTFFSETVVIRLRAASAYDGRMFSAWIDGVDCSGKDFVIKGWDKFEDYTGDVNLSPGHHTLKLISMMAT